MLEKKMPLQENMEVYQHFTINSIRSSSKWTLRRLDFATISHHLSKMPESLTPLWYQYYKIIQEDAPELVDEYLENTAARLNLPLEYLISEFL